MTNRSKFIALTLLIFMAHRPVEAQIFAKAISYCKALVGLSIKPAATISDDATKAICAVNAIGYKKFKHKVADQLISNGGANMILSKIVVTGEGVLKVSANIPHLAGHFVPKSRLWEIGLIWKERLGLAGTGIKVLNVTHYTVKIRGKTKTVLGAYNFEIQLTESAVNIIKTWTRTLSAVAAVKLAFNEDSEEQVRISDQTTTEKIK